jgi:hypothetical protein
MDVLDFVISSILNNEIILIYGIILAVLAKFILRLIVERLRYRNLVQSFFRLYSKFDRIEITNEKTKLGMILNNWINIYAYILSILLVLSVIIDFLMDASKKR